VSLALAFSLCAGILISNTTFIRTAHAASAKLKKSDDVDKKVKETAPGNFVNVIIQPNGAWSSALTTDLKNRGAVVDATYKNFSVRTARVKAQDVDLVSNRTDVSFISLNREVKPLGHITQTTGTDAARALAPVGKYDGTGIGIAIVDSGVDPNHVSVAGRIVANVDFTGENITGDPYGHGTHVASAAAGGGSVASGAYLGIASNAKIINLRVLNRNGAGTTDALLNALDWVLTNRTNTTYNIKVVNLSLGQSAVASYKDDPVCQAVRRLLDNGIVVAVAAGNNGKDASGQKVYGQIHSPGNEPSAITIGATNTFGTDARGDDAVTSFSSRGPTRSYSTDVSGVKHYDNLLKPDLVAPGNKVIYAQAANNLLVAQNPSLDANVSGNASKDEMYLNGTSMATPLVAGAAALMLQANSKLTPNMIKAVLMYTAQQLPNFNHFEQGAGQLNVEGAIRIAQLIRTDINWSTAATGTLMLIAPLPSAQTTTIAQQTFNWSQGCMMDQSFVYGSALMNYFQKVYATGALLADGTVESSGVLVVDSTLMSSGVLISDNILVSSGVLISDGNPFMGTGVLVSDGVLLNDGTLLADGVLVSDGVLISDTTLQSSFTTQAQSAQLNGDNTASMKVIVDTSRK
jgi:subtilisin family serine protease